MREELRTGLVVMAAIAVIIIVGTAGFILIEGWGLLDSLYMTVTTIFTVGFKEVHPLSTSGTVFTLFLIILGVGTILYGIGRMVEFVISGQLSGVFRRRVVRRQVDKLSGHFHSLWLRTGRRVRGPAPSVARCVVRRYRQ